MFVTGTVNGESDGSAGGNLCHGLGDWQQRLAVMEPVEIVVTDS
jgi:hypothetical protein